jgi:hypothetical protein
MGRRDDARPRGHVFHAVPNDGVLALLREPPVPER